MKRAAAIFALLALVVLGVQAAAATPAPDTRFVNTQDATCGGRSPCHRSALAAIDAAGAGHTVLIQTGTHVEQVEISGRNHPTSATESSRIVIEADPRASLGSVVLVGAVTPLQARLLRADSAVEVCHASRTHHHRGRRSGSRPPRQSPPEPGYPPRGAPRLLAQRHGGGRKLVGSRLKSIEGALPADLSSKLVRPGRKKHGQPAAICVLIIDELRVCREGLADLLRRESYISRVETAGRPDQALAAIRNFRPDVILLRVFASESIATLRASVSAFPGAKVVAMGVGETGDEVTQYVEVGAVGYSSREASLDDLNAVIQSVARDEVVCSPQVAARLFRRVAALSTERWSQVENARLTRRETEIVQLIDQGLSNREIAQRLGIDIYTVKNHVHSILEKLRVHRRGEAAARMRGVQAARSVASDETEGTSHFPVRNG